MILDGKKIAKEILEEIREQVLSIQGRKPHLALIIVGKNPASHAYVNAKKRSCHNTSILSTVIEYEETISEEILLQKIEELNCNPLIDGILIQLPLPKAIDEKKILLAIDPDKDVDGFHPMNMGKLLLGFDDGLIPCTPQGIYELLKRSNISIEGKHVVIVGRSNIVGKPLAALLMQKKKNCNATVTVAHSKSDHLEKIMQQAEILIVAMGKPHFVKKTMIQPKTVVIDVGITRLDNQLLGDVDFEEASSVASYITPVPGGVGPMTIAMLLKNTLKSFLKKNRLLQSEP